MALKTLTEDQIKTMSLAEKDRWWLKNVFRPNEPQLTLRSALTGMILGGALSLTNLYVGIRTGWTLGVGVTSVILAFAFFKVMAKLKIGKEMGILENNAMQSIAASAGYMTAPMVASLPAYMMVTGTVIPMWQTFWWITMLAVLGVLFAFPLKRRYINDEQMPFPEGYAAGVVMNNLHSDESGDGLFKAKVLGFGAGLAALIEFLRADAILEKIQLKFLALPHYWDEFIYKFATPAIMGTPLKDLTIRFDTSIVMMGTGGLMSMKTSMSLLFGAVVNYFFLAPYMIQQGVITGVGFRNITAWALWGGAAVMTTSSLYAFLSNPEAILSSFRRKKAGSVDAEVEEAMSHIELPIKVSMIGVPIFGTIMVLMGHYWFGVEWWLGVLAIPLVFIMTLIAVNSTGLTGITPGGALGKLTQVTYAILAPGNMSTNLATAGITGEVSLNASNLLMDIKPGYMLGARPRLQAIGHVLGIFAGALVAVPVFYSIFASDISRFGSDQLPLPSALIWKSVAEILSKGLGALHGTAQAAVVIGAVLGIAIEFFNKRMHGKFPLSAVGLGLAFVLPFTDSLAMALGTLIFWWAGRNSKDPKSLINRTLVQNQDTLAAGVIAGGALVGIVILLIETSM